MKKILLIIALVLCMFQMVVLATVIDIGSEAINRASSAAPGNTCVLKNNPANGTGIIDTVEIWSYATMDGVEVATFFLVSGLNYSTRDTHLIGRVSAGEKRTFTGLDIDVEEGDLIGIRWDFGNLERSSEGAGYYYKTGDYIPCTNETFQSQANVDLSLYGTGVTVEAEDNAIFFGMNF